MVAPTVPPSLPEVGALSLHRAAFTLGPWRRSGYRTIAAGTGLDTVTICEVWSGGVGIEQADGNESLIAAAPELFTAASEIYGLIDAGFLTIGVLAADNETRVAACGRAITALYAALVKASRRAAS